MVGNINRSAIPSSAPEIHVMSLSDQSRWNEKYANSSVSDDALPDEWLSRQVAGMASGRALDLACGLGHNAIWLAQQNWTVDAVDVSAVGLSLADQRAETLGCRAIRWIAADLDDFSPASATYDLVAVFRFLDRQRVPRLIVETLRPGGILVYETFLRAQMTREGNQLHSISFTLESGELPKLFPELTVLAYEEVERHDRTVARLSARKFL
jgi:2-polyprenyl-3-methyl-5-hydroxy-6-metoxy-1,4-benzoquinol methylase